MEALCEKMTEQNGRTNINIYTKTSDIWKAMYDDCFHAKKSIVFEQYILKPDKVGHKFLELFTRKAKEGVDVRLVLDSAGSRDLLFSSDISAFRKAGGLVHFYNPVGLDKILFPSKWFPRNHVKTLLVDKKICYSGSACVREDMANWHDLQIRFTGSWIGSVKENLFFPWIKRKKPAHGSGPSKNFAYIVSSPGVYPNQIYREILQAIDSAKNNVRIVTPYFLPPWLLRRALFRAIKRGIEVMVMVSEKGDVPVADWVSRSYYPKLLKHGVRIFHYQKTFLHAKYVLVDDKWVSVGSSNMDYISLLQNRESNIVTAYYEAVYKVREDFEHCLQHCHEIDMAYYRRLPWWQRILGRLCRGMRRVL